MWAYRQLIAYVQDENTQLKQVIASADKGLQMANSSIANLQAQIQRQLQHIAHCEEMNKTLARGFDKVIDAPPELRPKVVIEDIVHGLVEKQSDITNLENTNRAQEAQIKSQRQYIEQLEQYRKQELL